MAEVKVQFTAQNETDPATDKVVGNYDRIKTAAVSATDRIKDAFSTIGDKISSIASSATQKISALPEIMASAMVGATIAVATKSADTIGEKISVAFGGALRSALSAVLILAILEIFSKVAGATTQWTDSVVALGQKLQFTTEQASYFKVAMDEQRVSVDAVVSANSALGSTLTDNEEKIQALGVATRDSNDHLRSTAEVMPEVNTAISKIQDSTERNSASLSVYGKRWSDVTDVMKINVKTMEEARGQADRMGLIVGQNLVDATNKYKTAQASINLAMKGFAITIGSILLPMFAEVIRGISLLINAIRPPLTLLLTFIHKILEEAGQDIALFAYGLVEAASMVANGLAGNFEAVKQNFANIIDAYKEHQEKIHQIRSDWSNKPDKITPVTQDFSSATSASGSAADTATNNRIRQMWQELAVSKEVAAAQTANEKAQAEMQLATIKGKYALGQLSTVDYYTAVSRFSEEAARNEIKNAQTYLDKEKEVLEYIRTAKGADSEEYRQELVTNQKAIQAVQQAESSLAKTVIENSYNMRIALQQNMGHVFDAITSAAKTASETGRMALSFADSRYSDALQHQAEIIKEYGRTWTDIKQPVTSYLASINSVEAKQKQILTDSQNAIKSIMSINTNPKTGQSDYGQLATAALNQLSLDMLNIEKNAATQRLKVWDDYYKSLKGLIAAKQQEIDAANQELMDDRLRSQQLFLKITTPPVDNSGKDAVTLYWEKIAQMKVDIQTALASGDHDQAVKTIRDIQTQIGAMQDFKGILVDVTKTVRDFDGGGVFDQKIIDKTVTSQQEVITAAQKISDLTDVAKKAEDALEELGQKKIADLDKDMTRLKIATGEAKNAINELRDTLITLDDRISAMSRQITLTLEDRVTAGLAGVANALAALTGRTYTVNLQYSDNYRVSDTTDYSEEALRRAVGDDKYNSWLGPMSTGTNYVPRTGLALVHQGEAVVPAKYNPAAGGVGPAITIQGGISVTIQGGNTSQQTAAEIARQILPELNKLAGKRLAA